MRRFEDWFLTASQKNVSEKPIKVTPQMGNFDRRSMLPHAAINLTPEKKKKIQSKSLSDSKNLSDNLSENFYKFFSQAAIELHV